MTEDPGGSRETEEEPPRKEVQERLERENNRAVRVERNTSPERPSDLGGCGWGTNKRSLNLTTVTHEDNLQSCWYRTQTEGN